MDSIQECIDRIRFIFKEISGDYGFKTPVTDKEISRMEATLGFELPLDIKLLYKLHREMLISPQFEVSTFDYLHLFINSYNQEIKSSPPMRLYPPVRSVEFGKNLIPFGTFVGGYLGIDMNPGHNGCTGQIVAVSLQNATARVIAKNLLELFNKYIHFYDQAIENFNAVGGLNRPKKPAGFFNPINKKITEPADAKSFLSYLDEIDSSIDRWYEKDSEDWHYVDGTKVLAPVLEPSLFKRHFEFTPESDLGVIFLEHWSLVRNLTKSFSELPEYSEVYSVENFLPGLSDIEISQIEKTVGFSLPSQLRASLKVCDLQYLTTLWDGLCWLGCLPTDSFEGRFRGIEFQLFPGTRQPIFDETLIPFATSDYVYVCVDLNPSQGGSIGQIIEVDSSECFTCKVVAENFVDWLERGIVKMEKELVDCLSEL